VLGTSTEVSYVTQDELTAQIEQAANALRSLIYQNESAPNSVYATGGYTNDIAISNRIDNLSGSSNGPLTISDATFNNVSGLTASEIPDLSGTYLPLTGGTISGPLTVTGAFSGGSLNLSTASTTNFIAQNATSTNLFATAANFGSLTLTSPLGIASGATGTSTAPSANKLLLSDANGNWEYAATSSLGFISAGSALTSIGPSGQSQNGPAVTLASSTNTVNGLTSALTITGAENTLTFAPAISGTLTVAGGGTGSTTLSGLLKGNGTGALLSAVAGIDYQAPLTFSYPLSNTSNTVSLAFGTTTTNSWSQLQTFTGGFLSAASSTVNGNFTVTGTDTLPGIVANAILYNNASQQLAAAVIGSGLTFSGGTLSTSFGTTTTNAWTALQQFQNASSSRISVYGPAYFGGTATSTFDSAGDLTVAGSLTANGNVTLGNATSTNFFSTNASTTNATSTNLFVSLGNFTTGFFNSLTASIANITGLTVANSTTTNATTTNLYAASAVIPSLTAANATSTSFYATNLTAGNISAPIQSQNQYVLRSTMTKIAEMQTAAPAQLRIVEWGDSVAGFHAGPLIAKLKGELGNAGFIIGGTINSTSGSVTATTGDFTSTPTGSYEDIASGGCVVYGNGGSYQAATKLSLFYIAEPSAGTLTLSTNLNGAGFVTGPSVNAANSSRIGGVLSTTTSSTGPWTIRACASGGPVKVWGSGFENLSTNGVIQISVAQGGIALSDMNYPSTAITGPWFVEFDPDLVTFEMKHNAPIEPDTTTRLQDLDTFVANWQAANPLVDFLLIGGYPVSDPTQVPYNQALATVAQANNAVYWDGYSPSINESTEEALGWITPASDPHQTALGQAAESNLLWSQLGLGSLINASTTNNVNNQSTQTNALTIAGSATGPNDTSVLTFYSPNTTGTQASITSSWWNGGHITFTAPRDLANNSSGFLFNSNSGTTRMYIDSSTGNVGIGTSTPGSLLSLGGIANFTTATSSFYGTGGINLQAGCFAVNGTCLAAGGGSGTVNSGTAGQVSYYSSSGTAVSGTSALTIFGTNVGVNNTRPTLTLDISTSTSASSFTGTSTVGVGIRQTGNDENYSGIDFFSNTITTNPIARIAMTTTGAGSFLQFGTTYSWAYGITNSALTITPSGYVGVATTSPSSTFAIGGSEFLNGNLTFNNNSTQINFTSQYDGGNPGFLEYYPAGTDMILNAGRNNFNGLLFQTNVSGSALTRIAILNGGNVGIGTTTPYSRLTIWGPDTSSGTAAETISNSASTTEWQVFDNGNATLAGTLTQNSDQRLKTNIQSLDASSSLAALDALNPVTFNWIDPSEGSTTQVGFIAQQVQQIFPNLVSTTSATALTPGGTLGLNYIGLIAPAVSAIQALYSDVQSLEQTVTGFAQSFTSNTITANRQLFVKQSDGTPICITGDQLAALLAAENQSPAAAQPSPSGGSNPPGSVTQTEGTSTTATTPPTITITGDNPAIITVGDSYADLGATVSDTGPGQAGDTNLGITTFLNGTLVSNIVLDTSEIATDTIDYVATDTAGLTATSTRTVLIEPTTVSTTTVQ
jgi:hypothetical protein